MATTTTQDRVPGGALGTYLVEVRKEMRKVNWPKRQELINNTALTLGATLVLSLLIFGADQLISRLLTIIYN